MQVQYQKKRSNQKMDKRQLANRVWPEHEFADAVEAPVEKKLIKNISLLVISAITLMVVWSVFTTVEEIAKARGQVVPLGNKQVIQSQLGGTLANVLVEEGDVVKKGDVLANFVAVDSKSAKEELASQRANVLMKIERYNAFKEQRPAAFLGFETQYPDLVRQQHQALAAMNLELNAINKSAQSEIEKNNAEYQALADEIPALKNQIDASEQTKDMLNKLIETGGVSKIQVLENQQKLDSYTRELTVMEGREKVLSKNLVNLNDQLAQREATLFNEVGEKLTDAQAELLIYQARLKSSDSQVMQTTIIAPVDAIVQSIPSNSSGSVIAPGGTVAVLVPTTETAILEAKLSPRDIGFVTIGQAARIKIDAFDYSRYGALDGIVEKISPTTDADEKGGVFYKVKIHIKKPYFGDAPGKFDLIPGMTGEADIVTGDKTVFQYLWKPVFTNVNSAFGER